MDRVAVFVDAGYLYAGGAKSVTGADGTKRHEISLEIPAVLTYLIAKAESLSGRRLLRIYWYDAAPSGRLTTDHQILASSDNLKLRLGVLNGVGQQKGVDGKIITDLAELSRNRAFADVVLLGGDEDLRIGVELSQEYGTRVHLLTIEGSSSAPTLRQESDTVTTIARSDMQTFLTVKHLHPPATGLTLVASAANPDTSAVPSRAFSPLEGDPTSPVRTSAEESTAGKTSIPDAWVADQLDTQIKVYLDALPPTELISLTAALRTGAGVPVEHDGRLLARARQALGRQLNQVEKAKLRRALKKALGV